MKTFRYILITGAIITSTLQIYAQDQVEALTFSERFPQSDARAMGAGNAFGAVGANLICSSINPGSLALYKKSEFSFSLGFLSNNVSGNYLGTLASDHRYALDLPQVGLAVTINNTKNGEAVKDGWLSYTLSGTINRMNSFQTNRYFEGLNTKSSVLYHYAETANGTLYKNLSLNNVGGLAWDTYLIDTTAKDPNHNTYVPIDTSKIRNFYQQNSIKTRGSNYDINIAFAGNYSDKVFIGAAISFPTIKYNETRDFTETNKNENPASYISSDYSRELDISGTGVQVSFGIVVKPIKFIRIGGSIQSPTYYSLSGKYSQVMNSQLVGNSYTQSSSGEMEFNFTAPFRATGSLAFIAGKYGFLAVDYEFVDYSQGYYSSNSYQYISENNQIQNIYTAASNLRFGGELKLDIFALRAGYGMYGSPYKSITAPVGADASAQTLSFGVGMRENNYFIDFAYQQLKTKKFYLPYSLSQNTMEKYNVDEVTGNIDDIKQNTFLVTFGVKF